MLGEAERIVDLTQKIEKELLILMEYMRVMEMQGKKRSKWEERRREFYKWHFSNGSGNSTMDG